MGAETKTEEEIRCPECGRFLFLGEFTRILVICGEQTCRAKIVVTIGPNGNPVLEVLRRGRNTA